METKKQVTQNHALQF